MVILPDTPDQMRRRQHDGLFIVDELLDEELPVCTWTVFPAERFHALGVIHAPPERLREDMSQWARFLRAEVQQSRTPLWPGWRLSCAAEHRGISLEICAHLPDVEELEPTALEDLVGAWARTRPQLGPRISVQGPLEDYHEAAGVDPAALARDL